MGESIGVGDVPEAVAVGAKLVLRAEQFKADLLAKVTEITAKDQSPDVFPNPGDEFSQAFATTYTKNAHTLKGVLAGSSGGTSGGSSGGAPSSIGDAMVDVGNYITDAFVSLWQVDQQNSKNVGSA